MEHIVDYESRAKKIVVEYYKSATNLVNLIQSFSGDSQELEDVLQDWLAKANDIELSSGILLDSIGDTVGESRNSRLDIDYRLAIYQRIALNISGGQAEVLISIAVLFTGATKVGYTPVYPANVSLTFYGGTNPGIILSKLETALPSGVRLLAIWVENVPFGFDNDSEALGYNEVGEDIGGELSEVYVL